MSFRPQTATARLFTKPKPRVLGQAGFGLLLLSTLWPGGGPFNTSVSDAVLLALAAFFILPALLMRGISVPLAQRARWPLIVILLTAVWQLLLLLSVGGDLVWVIKDVFAVGFLFAGLALLLPHINERDLRPALWSAICVGVLLTIAVVAEGFAGRASGTFSNPNFAGAWLGSLVVLLLASGFPARWQVRLPIVAVLTVGTLATQSFSAVFGGVLAATYIALNRLRLHPMLRGTLLLGGVAIAYLAVMWVDVIGPTSRTDRSFGSREAIWLEGLKAWVGQPVGVGPGTYSSERMFNERGTELHSDIVQALVEGGVVGLALLVLLFVVIGRAGGVATRSSLIFFAGIAMWRDAMNFRFLWLLLALAMAFDFWSHPLAKRRAAS